MSIGERKKTKALTAEVTENAKKGIEERKQKSEGRSQKSKYK